MGYVSVSIPISGALLDPTTVVVVVTSRCGGSINISSILTVEYGAHFGSIGFSSAFIRSTSWVLWTSIIRSTLGMISVPISIYNL